MNTADGHPHGVPVPRPEPEPVTPGLLEVLGRSRSLGFLGDGELEVHVANASTFLADIEVGSRVLDLGSGGGVPGLVLAQRRPDLEIVLLDGMQKRTAFLEVAVEDLALGDRVCVVRGRAEEVGRDPRWRAQFDVVTARSFGPPAVTAECAVGFLRGPGGRVLVSEPPTDSSERWPAQGLTLLGLSAGARRSEERSTIQRLDVVEPCGDRYPRRTGVPAKRPLF